MSDTQLNVTHKAAIEAYRDAATLLWGDAGRYAVDTFIRLNVELFDGQLPPMPIVIGLSAYGRCIGLTRDGTHYDWLQSPRITLVPSVFNKDGLRTVDDVLVHEMVHARLILRGDNPAHNEKPWCNEIRRLSPVVVGHEINAQPVRTRRVPNPARQHDPKEPKTIVTRQALPDVLTRKQLASWPHSMRPADFYDNDERIHVPTY